MSQENTMQESQLKVSRSFAAPQEALWKAWTEPEHFKQWYGPTGFTVPVCEIDLKLGGCHFWSMRAPNGQEMFYAGEYLEISPMDKLVYSDAMVDAEGNPLDPAAMGMPEGMRASMDVTVTFEHQDGMTTVTVSHVASGPEDRAGSGWEMAFDKLAEALASGRISS